MERSGLGVNSGLGDNTRREAKETTRSARRKGQHEAQDERDNMRREAKGREGAQLIEKTPAR